MGGKNREISIHDSNDVPNKLIMEEPTDENQLTSEEDDYCVPNVSILTDKSYTTTTTGVDMKKKTSTKDYFAKDAETNSGSVNTESDPFLEDLGVKIYSPKVYWRRQCMKSLKFHYRYSEDESESNANDEDLPGKVDDHIVEKELADVLDSGDLEITVPQHKINANNQSNEWQLSYYEW